MLLSKIYAMTIALFLFKGGKKVTEIVKFKSYLKCLGKNIKNGIDNCNSLIAIYSKILTSSKKHGFKARLLKKYT